MGFSQPFSESHSIQMAIQLEKQDGKSGGGSSPILHGTEQQFADGMGPSAPIEVLVPRRTKIHVRTDQLTRKYASTGSGDGGETSNKGYSSGTIGKKNLRGH